MQFAENGQRFGGSLSLKICSSECTFLQDLAHEKFGRSFEVIVGVSDFVQKSNYIQNFYCKRKSKSGRVSVQKPFVIWQINLPSCCTTKQRFVSFMTQEACYEVMRVMRFPDNYFYLLQLVLSNWNSSRASEMTSWTTVSFVTFTVQNVTGTLKSYF